jgi:2-dehydro-3-deoxygluconokinase
MRKKVCCFGELLLRFSPALQQEWIKKNAMPVFVGGAELNVAKALRNWNVPVKYITALPDNYLSTDIAASLRDEQIDVSDIIFQGERIGTYTLPMGADLKNAGVIYDRAHSAFAALNLGTINWDKVLEGYDWFHFSAICPALNASIAAVCEEALQAATKKGMTISVDLNYRAKLWQYGKKPVEVMPALAQYCHIIMGNIWSAHQLLGTGLDSLLDSNSDKNFYTEHAAKTSKEIMKHFPTCNVVANTFRFSEADAVRYYATVTTGDSHVVAFEQFVTSVVDKVGSGDCFMAGLIYGSLQQWDLQTVVNFASSAAFGKLQEKGDSTQQSVAQINNRF